MFGKAIAAAMATVQARLESFKAPAPATKGRRSSKTTKKATVKKAAWPLTSPTPADLAFAGFHWKPSPVAPDNVMCNVCNCQLDGWEASDVPAYEHLTHSPTCGFAINICIRLRTGDPGRVEDDPLSEILLQARRDTFGDLWPLDTAAGYPSVDQMIQAGWCYDPQDDAPDGVTCPYCSLSLDAWDIGDDPLEEHQRRATDCLFFSLKDSYHPVPTKGKGKKRASRASSRTSTTRKVSTTKAASKSVPKAPKRGTKRSSEAESVQDQPEPKRTRRPSTPVEFPSPASFSLRTPEAAGTPRFPVPEWLPIDIDQLLDGTGISAVDAAQQLTDAEKSMTVEQWILFNAQQYETKLRSEFDRQIAAFEAEGKRALEVIDSL